MANLISLTEIVNGTEQLLAVNPDHVASLRPRKTVTALDVQQGDPRSTISYNGTILQLATGEQHFVVEDFEVVHSKLVGPKKTTPPPLTAQEQAKRVAGRLGMGQAPSLKEHLTPTPTYPAPDLGDDPDGDNTT